ncbi:MAG: hypothetical protein R3F55_25445 [Alphaproteobacteria bacterium]
MTWIGTWRGGVSACLLVAGCVAADPAPQPAPPILCEQEYSNAAWPDLYPPIHWVLGIASDGRILGYDPTRADGSASGAAGPGVVIPPPPPSARSLQARYAGAVPLDRTVPAADLARIVELAWAIRDGDLVETGEPTVFDAGVDTLRCFVPIPGSDILRVVPVARRLAAPAVNDHPETTELIGLLDRAFGNRP